MVRTNEAALRRREPERRGNGLGPPPVILGRSSPPGSRTTPTRSPRAPASPSGLSSTSIETSATATPAPRIRAPTEALAEICRTRLEHCYGGGARDPARPLQLLEERASVRICWLGLVRGVPGRSTTTSSSWPGRSPPRFGGRMGGAALLPPGRGLGVQRQLDRSAIEPASPTSTRCPMGSSWKTPQPGDHRGRGDLHLRLPAGDLL